MSTTLRRNVLLAASLVMLAVAAGCDQAVQPTAGESAAPAAEVEPAPAPAAPVAVPETDPAKATERRISDLLALKAAIDAYHAENGSYPPAYNGLKGVIDRGADWIPGLAPKYIAALPRDPALSDSKDGPQYLYISDTKDFKLIAHGVGDTCGPQVERDGIQVDPERKKDDGSKCWAYGFWTGEFVKF
ncbi:MAG: type II secretion system protein GspG [Hyphomonadaceae bacterium]